LLKEEEGKREGIVGGQTSARRKGPTRTSLGYQASKQ